MSDKPAQNYKDTIQLPKTSFPMKANLPQTEPKRIEFWKEISIYEKLLEKNASAESFIMPDGPPYANGNIHLGHVLNKVLKDIVIKYQNMKGRRAPYIPGWDCHGLPIELKVTKKLGKKRLSMSDREIRDLCRQEARVWIDKQRESFIRLGILGEWESPYLTMNPEYEAEEIRVLADIVDNGVLYRGLKPVYWCPALQTALAAAEAEYHDHKSPSIYVKFDFLDTKIFGDKPTSIVIWTTTPWTLPANLAVALHESFTYGLYSGEKGQLIIAEDLKESFEEDTGLSLKLEKTFKGSELEGLKTKHPFIDRESKVILSGHVSLEAGTGCVHIAPGHGMDDYMCGLKYNLPIICPVDEAGKYTDEFAAMKGIKIWDANPRIVDLLQSSGHLLAHKEISHSYPHNPRTKTPLIFRATSQWFVSMDKDEYPVREKALTSAEKDIRYVPPWGIQRLTAMISNSPDWCLSRQRIWGVPIPVFYCQECDHPLADAEVMRKVADAMEETGEGIEAYHSQDASHFTGGKTCQECGNKNFKKGRDILDVWFDSGICHAAVQRKREGLGFPADIYLEGSDQHRGWFQTSLISSIASNGQAPYKALITHGFVNDSKGYKMSKSVGNVIDPADVMKKSGAEILRLWVSYEDYGQDVNVGEEIFQRVTETYRRFRNTIRFMLGNLNDFDSSKNMVEFENMPPLDQWALVKLNELIEKVGQAYENYDFYKVYHLLNNFFTVVLSATYLDILKDRLYTWKQDGLPRRSAQTVIQHLLENLSTMMAPIASFLAEDTYQHIPNKAHESVFLEDFPEKNDNWIASGVVKNFDILLEVRSEASKVLENLRKDKTIGSSLDAQVHITAPETTVNILMRFSDHLREFLIVSQVTYEQGLSLKIDAKRAKGGKCVRCWHYSEDVNNNENWPDICSKCVEALA